MKPRAMNSIRMKKRMMIRIAILGLALSGVSCMESTEAVSGGDPLAPATVQISFTARMEPGQTRTSLLDRAVFWNTGDRIRVFNEAHPTGEVFSLTAGAGTAEGTFTGPEMGAGPYSAVYPAEAGTLLEGAALRVVLPGVQTYAEGSFGPGANLSVGHAEVLEGMTFRNVCGVLALTLTGEKVIRTLRITTVGEETLSGTARVTALDTEAPALALEAGSPGEEARQLTLGCGTAGVPLSGEGKTFHLVLPAGTLAQGFFLEAVDADGNAMVRHSVAQAALAIERNGIRPMPALAYEPRYKDAFLTSDGVGAYANVSAKAGAMTMQCRYSEGQSQYAYLNMPGENGSRYLRIADWDAGFSLAFTMPFDLPSGGTATVTIQSLGNTGVSSGTGIPMRVVKQSEDRVWLFDAASGNGYILMKTEGED